MHLVPNIASAAAELRRTSWLQLAGYAWIGFFVVFLVKLAAPAGMGPALRACGLVLPLLLLAAKDLAHAPDALRRLQGADNWRGRITALLPPELLGMLRIERLMWRGFLRWLRRRPAATAPEGTALTYLRRGAYGSAIGVVMVALFLELPINILLVNLMIDEPTARLAIHVACGAGALYSFVWVLADRWHVGDASHVLAGEMLHLRVGVRSQGAVPLSAIERCEAVTEAPERWSRRHGIHRADTLLVTPFDKPNCVLFLKPDATVTLLHWQVQRQAPRYLLLYLDRPERLASHVNFGVRSDNQTQPRP
ncbi:hypothetical protein [Massilia yuzhufengensis]|uniref:Uncharacterized protein n=1 Tax=Massilia yuzhufengensis TaxID=1164594 RepID=A0A1I1W564_9BURK|nr:hypothetical protein [Massilia yuzhufengensis]SFD90139.1 hypothetical protein SAMN05216204_1454 [Massilia yuzhufengensis]